MHSRLIMLGIGGLALYVVLPQIGGFRDSLHIAIEAQPSGILLAVGCMLVAFAIAAGTYCILALEPLRYFRTVLAQMAAMFVNRLLPAGVGGIGANYVYLRKSRHTVPQAASVVTANNLIGLIGHLALTLAVAAVFYDQPPNLSGEQIGQRLLFFGAIIVLLFLILIFATTLKGRIVAKIAAVAAQIVLYRKQPLKLAAAFCTSLTMTLVNVLCLWFCVQAVGVSLSFIAVLLIFTLGVAIGTATPSPGGLGGVEAGLVAGMLAYGISSSVALAVALTYRFINYWLALAIGAVAFTICRRKKIL